MTISQCNGLICFIYSSSYIRKECVKWTYNLIVFSSNTAIIAFNNYLFKRLTTFVGNEIIGNVPDCFRFIKVGIKMGQHIFRFSSFDQRPMPPLQLEIKSLMDEFIPNPLLKVHISHVFSKPCERRIQLNFSIDFLRRKAS